MNRVYLDYNATAPLRREVRDLLIEALAKPCGNPSSLHRSGRAARARVDEARASVAASLNVHEDEIIFTSGGTESNNLALCGCDGARRRLAVPATEHSSILEPARSLERQGSTLRWLGVDGEGLLRLDALEAWLGEHERYPEGAGLLVASPANGELGVLVPMGEVARRLGALEPGLRPAWHADCVQALGRIDLPLGVWGVDTASFSVHKLGGPVGVGVLYKRRGHTLEPRQWGGGQEAGLRGGTESVSLIEGAALALALAVREREETWNRWRDLEQRFWSALRSRIEGLRLVGPEMGSPHRLAGTLNVLQPGVDGKVLVTRLDVDGLEASAGSACASGSSEPSPAMLALGFAPNEARAGLRLSMGRDTRWSELEQAVEILGRAYAAFAATPCSQQGLGVSVEKGVNFR